MKRLLFFIALLSLTYFTACHQSVEIPQSEVAKVLTEYGKQNPENLVVITTDFGEIKLRLYEETPLHRANLIRLIKMGYFTESMFYRVVEGFVIQGGADTMRGMERPRYEVPAEIHPNLIHKRGALGMSSFHEKVSSAASEFYIVQGLRYTDKALKEENIRLDSLQYAAYTTSGGEYTLDGKYTVFGEVVSGFESIEQMIKIRPYDIDKPENRVAFKIKIVKE